MKAYQVAGIVCIVLVLVLMNAGCISAVKSVYRGTVTTPAPTPVPEVIIPTQIPAPVYTEMPESYEEWKYRSNGRNLGEWYSWRRDDVSGTKDMLAHAVVYGYRIEPNYWWWSVSWGRYFCQVPDHGMKYLFVYTKVWLEGNNGTWDPRLYGFDWNHYRVQIGSALYEPDTNYVAPNRIKELEETSDYSDVVKIGPFGCLHINDQGKESCIWDQWIRMGDENGLDGFILFEIPASTKPEDISVIGNYRGFGSAWWNLTTESKAVVRK